MGKVAEIGKTAAHSLEYAGEKLKIGDRVVMCPDILCGKCWYCRNTFGFPLCQAIKGYGNAFTCDESPHLMGGWADYIYVRKDAFVFKVPEDMEPRIAVMSELMTCTFNLDKAKELYTMGGKGSAQARPSSSRAWVPSAPCMCSKAGSWGRGPSSRSTVPISGFNWRRISAPMP